MLNINDNFQISEQIDLPKKYKLLIGSSNDNCLIIDIIEKNKLNNKKYRIKLTLNDLIKKSKTFKMCDSINDCITLIKKLCKEKIISIIPKENNFINIHFKEFMLSQEFDILLEGIKPDQKEIIEQLSNKVIQLEEKLENLEKWKKEIENKIIGYTEQSQILNSLDSKIINKKEEIDFLEKCLKKDDPLLSKKNIQFKLLYRASRDGDSSYTFHSKCDQKVNVLFVIQTLKGLKFGGYTEQTWEVTGSAKTDNNLFVFSLDYLKKYNCIKGKQNMSPDKDRGPRIGN